MWGQWRQWRRLQPKLKQTAQANCQAARCPAAPLAAPPSSIPQRSSQQCLLRQGLRPSSRTASEAAGRAVATLRHLHTRVVVQTGQRALARCPAAGLLQPAHLLCGRAPRLAAAAQQVRAQHGSRRRQALCCQSCWRSALGRTRRRPPWTGSRPAAPRRPRAAACRESPAPAASPAPALGPCWMQARCP